MADFSLKVLDVTVHRADDLENVEKLGRQDPYVVLFLGINDPNKSTKTKVAKSAGVSPSWEERLTLEQLNQDSHVLYVEVMDDEKVGDRIIGFTAIPLSQVRECADHRFTGTFDVYTREGARQGTISLTLCIRDRHEQAHEHTIEGAHHIHKGRTLIIPEHKKRVGTLVYNKNVALPVAAAAGEVVVEIASRAIGIHADIENAKNQKEVKAAMIEQDEAIIREI
ncbi:hypothetical protein BGW41_004113 [Actinomortierella wolfii]|nr:hypothetical protein BGW41_004113 [Actinomortierella wolfii]